jgi:hypothetical protein
MHHCLRLSFVAFKRENDCFKHKAKSFSDSNMTLFGFFAIRKKLIKQMNKQKEAYS